MQSKPSTARTQQSAETGRKHGKLPWAAAHSDQPGGNEDGGDGIRAHFDVEASPTAARPVTCSGSSADLPHPSLAEVRPQDTDRDHESGSPAAVPRQPVTVMRCWLAKRNCE